MQTGCQITNLLSKAAGEAENKNEQRANAAEPACKQKEEKLRETMCLFVLMSDYYHQLRQ